MKRYALICLVCYTMLNAADSSAVKPQSGLLNCSIIFEERKSEIKAQLDEIDEKIQALQVLQNATQMLLDEKDRQLRAKEAEIDNKIMLFAKEQEKTSNEAKESEARKNEELSQREQQIRNLIAQNEAILAQIKQIKDDKIVNAYRTMKEAKAASILSGMPESQAVEILSKMEVRDITKILAKMDDDKAASITAKIRAIDNPQGVDSQPSKDNENPQTENVENNDEQEINSEEVPQL